MNYNCPKCNSGFTPGTKFCQTCGCNLELEYVQNPVCPKCRTSYPPNTKFCITDGTKLVRPEDLIPKCVICKTAYTDNTRYCPKDGGEVKILLTNQGQQSGYQPGPQSGYQPAPQTGGYQPGQPPRSFNSNQMYPKASVGNRILAAILDSLISVGLSIPAIIFLVIGMQKLDSYYDSSGASGILFMAVLLYMLPLGYAFIKDGLGNGQSWGKKALDLMVVNLDDNTPCDKGKSALRTLISILVNIIPVVGWLIEPIMVIATDDGRKLGDKAANTQVIEVRDYNNRR